MYGMQMMKKIFLRREEKRTQLLDGEGVNMLVGNRVLCLLLLLLVLAQGCCLVRDTSLCCPHFLFHRCASFYSTPSHPFQIFIKTRDRHAGREEERADEMLSILYLGGTYLRWILISCKPSNPISKTQSLSVASRRQAEAVRKKCWQDNDTRFLSFYSTRAFVGPNELLSSQPGTDVIPHQLASDLIKASLGKCSRLKGQVHRAVESFKYYFSGWNRI